MWTINKTGVRGEGIHTACLVLLTQEKVMALEPSQDELTAAGLWLYFEMGAGEACPGPHSARS